MSISADLPPSLQTPFTTPPPERMERRWWQATTAPAFIGLFLWVVYLDPLAVRTLPVGGLGWSVAGAAIAGLLCYRLLYYVPAMWGMRTGFPLTVLGTSTFGVEGATWLTGLLMGLAQVVWFAVANFYATELILEALVSCRLLGLKSLRPLVLGGLSLQSPLFLFTSLVWCYWSALTGAYLVRLISALMRICPIFPAAMLGWAVLLSLSGLPQFQPPGIDPVTGESVRQRGPRACAWMVQMIFGFFATAGAASADWGVAVRNERDVRMGGWVGVVIASWVMATLALLTVAGGVGRLGPASRALGLHPAAQYTFHQVIFTSIGGWVGSVMLLIFGLVALAPATYASYVFSHRFAALRPRIPRWRWTLIGATAAWCLIAPGIAGQLEAIFGLMGALFAPLVGAMAADYYRHRGEWPGPRQGVNQAGLVAWVMGLTVGLVPLIARAWGRVEGARFQPATVFAFLTGFLVYLLMAWFGAEAPAQSLSETAGSPENS